VRAAGRQEREQESREQQRQVAILQEEARKTNASLREACERVSIRRARACLRRPALPAPLGDGHQLHHLRSPLA
jgi:hypothetical protein